MTHEKLMSAILPSGSANAPPSVKSRLATGSWRSVITPMAGSVTIRKRSAA